MTLPSMKTILAVGAAVALADYAGDKLANSIIGPEINSTDKYVNQAKVTAAKTAMGVFGFVAFHAIFGA